MMCAVHEPTDSSVSRMCLYVSTHTQKGIILQAWGYLLDQRFTRPQIHLTENLLQVRGRVKGFGLDTDLKLGIALGRIMVRVSISVGVRI